MLASLPDTNTLIFIVVAIVSGISGWLEKRRKAAASEQARGDRQPPHPSTREAAPAPPSMEEVLRRILGGEQPPSESTPPLAPYGEEPARERPVVMAREHPPEAALEGGADAPAMPQHARRPTHPELIRAALPALSIEKWTEKPILRPELASASERSSAAIASIHRARRSPEAQLAVSMVRNPRAARSAFIASLVFGPPKSLENSQP